MKRIAGFVAVMAVMVMASGCGLLTYERVSSYNENARSINAARIHNAVHVDQVGMPEIGSDKGTQFATVDLMDTGLGAAWHADKVGTTADVIIDLGTTAAGVYGTYELVQPSKSKTSSKTVTVNTYNVSGGSAVTVGAGTASGNNSFDPSQTSTDSHNQ